MALLEVTNLAVTFRTDDGPVQAVRGVDFSVDPGKVLAIDGDNFLGGGMSIDEVAARRVIGELARELGLSDREAAEAEAKK